MSIARHRLSGVRKSIGNVSINRKKPVRSRRRRGGYYLSVLTCPIANYTEAHLERGIRRFIPRPRPRDAFTAMSIARPSAIARSADGDRSANRRSAARALHTERVEQKQNGKKNDYKILVGEVPKLDGKGLIISKRVDAEYR